MKHLLPLLCLFPARLQADMGVVHVRASIVSEARVSAVEWEARADVMGGDARAAIAAVVLPSGTVTDLTSRMGEWVDFGLPNGEAYAAR